MIGFNTQDFLPILAFLVLFLPFLFYKRNYKVLKSNLKPDQQYLKQIVKRFKVPRSKPGRPCYHFIREQFDEDTHYEYLKRNTKVPKRLPVIIIPDCLGGASTDAVMRAAILFHCSGSDVYIPIASGTQGTMVSSWKDPMTSIECLSQLIAKLNGETHIYAVGSGFVKLNKVQQKIQGLQVAAFPVSSLKLEEEFSQLKKLEVFNNKSDFGVFEVKNFDQVESSHSFKIFALKQFSAEEGEFVKINMTHMGGETEDGFDIPSHIANQLFQ